MKGDSRAVTEKIEDEPGSSWSTRKQGSVYKRDEICQKDIGNNL